jgi:UDP-N-acetylmuramoyl-L-alanyl-D-glutamate--2,6-diaminopimelate ligase
MLQITGRASGVRLRQVLPAGRMHRGDDFVATSCCIDAAQCAPGDLFVALTHAKRDTHDDVHKAIERGAMAVLCERLLPIDVPQCIVDDSRIALGQLAQELAGRPTDHLTAIGVAGTQGKTVTTHLIAAVLGAARQATGVLSSIGYSDSVEQRSPEVPTPTAPAFAHWLGRMVDRNCRAAVVEVSRRALAERRLAGAQFDAAVLTSLRPAATDDVSTLHVERQIQGRILEQLKTSGFVVANADDANVQTLLRKLDVPVLTYALHGEAEITATVLERHASEQTFLIHAGNETIAVCTEMIGDHHVRNCLAATATGLVLGIDLPTIARGLESQRFMPGRLQRVECGQPFNVYIDAARTPEMLAQALKAVRHVTPGRVICVAGAEGQRHKRTRAEIGRVVERLADEVIITSQNPRREEPLQIAHGILDGMTDVASPRLLPNRAKAIEWALSEALPGDSVVVTGLGEADYHVIGKKKHRHDDREVARRWLYEVGATREYPASKIAPW